MISNLQLYHHAPRVGSPWPIGDIVHYKFIVLRAVEENNHHFLQGYLLKIKIQQAREMLGMKSKIPRVKKC
jgi:hypothetical protein